MSIWLNPRGKSTFGIGLCDRCSRKMSLDDLYKDPNFPGLRVCKNDLDELDPWRLPARQTEDIHLPFTRPDLPLDTAPLGLMLENDNYFIVSENYEYPNAAKKSDDPNYVAPASGWIVP